MAQTTADLCGLGAYVDTASSQVAFNVLSVYEHNDIMSSLLIVVLDLVPAFLNYTWATCIIYDYLALFGVSIRCPCAS